MHFPNLNALRFIAATLVIIHHIEQFKGLFGLPSLWGTNSFIDVIGRLGVILFFVLSGFLITFLLMKEESDFKRIDIKAFYLRRALRIWPLYFLVIFLALAVLPFVDIFQLPGYPSDRVFTDLTTKVFLYVFFLPNLVLSGVGVVPYASQTWSIGTEEQFYLIWPIILTLFRRKRIAVMLTVIIAHIAVRVILSDYTPSFSSKLGIRAFWDLFSVHSMATGGIFAILLFKRSKVLILLFNQGFFYLIFTITVVLIALGVTIPFFHVEIYSVLFGLIILNLAANDKIRFSLEIPLLNFLGRISYGLYMYHSILIVLSIRIVLALDVQSNGAIYALSFLMTTAISSLSYKYFEKPFLKQKQRFTRVVSSP